MVRVADGKHVGVALRREVRVDENEAAASSADFAAAAARFAACAFSDLGAQVSERCALRSAVAVAVQTAEHTVPLRRDSLP